MPAYRSSLSLQRWWVASCASWFLLAGCGGGGGGDAVAAPPPAVGAHEFVNPIVPAGVGGSADPSVVFRDGHYHYCRVLGNGAIAVAKARRLQDIGTAPMTTVWTPPPGTAWSQEVWAPELQYLRGKWYIYFAASDGNNANHRMYALEGGASDSQATYTFKGRLSAGTGWAIDGLALEHEGQMYFVWSGWRGATDGFPQVLYIARMSDPLTISGERHEIASPDRAWEQSGAPLLEGPAVLSRNGKVFITYSASASWTDDYALGLLTFSGGDILDGSAWVKTASAVFAKRPDAATFGPGHNTFVKSPDGAEDWIVFHAIDRSGGGWSQRSVRAQRFGWRSDGRPDFGIPASPALPLAEPSGSPDHFADGDL